MEANQPWYTRPVFLSSTFKDMHAERDHLRQHVFPKLAEDLRERRCHLETIDLRMGVETVELGSEEEKELRVLKVCLNEIVRSRPFLIVLLGDRYGWVPPESRMKAAAQEAGFQTEVTGKSVTALEIEFGILLKDPEQRRRCLFFFRDPLPYDQIPPEIAAQYSDKHATDEAVRAGHAKLVALKTSIEKNPDFRGRVHHYRTGWDKKNQRVTGLDDFGKLVARTLWIELDGETKAHAQPGERTWEDLERDALAEFVEQRSRDFLGREGITNELLALARSPVAEGQDGGACVTGVPGSGKSALFAHLFRALQEAKAPASNGPKRRGLWDRLFGQKPDEADRTHLVLAHAAGISARATSVDALLRRWIGELAAFLVVRDPLSLNASPEDVENTFASLLGRTSARTRVVVLIDALNQFEPTTRARFLTWLPKLWPANARLIVTTLPGDQAEALRSRSGVRLRELPNLSVSEAEAIAQAVCKRYHRTLNSQVLRLVTAKRLPDGTPAAGNPLWLTLAVEQLNLLDEDDFARADREFSGTPEQRLHQMVLDVARRMPPDVVGLYGWLLDQTEKIHGSPFARAFADLIALSRFGWRESDLRVLVPAVAELLFRDCPLKDWDDLKLAALRRGFRAHIARRGLAEQWDFFHLQMRQAIRHRNLGDHDLARRIHSAVADHLARLPSSDPLRQSELMVHLIGADDRARAARTYGGALSAGEETGATRALATHILAGIDSDPNPGLDWVISLPDQLSDEPDWTGVLCNRFNFDLSDAIANEANLASRRGLLAAAEHILMCLINQDSSNAEWQHDLSVSHGKLGDVLVVQGDAAGALKAYQAALAICERLATQDPSNAEWHHDLSVSHEKVGGVLVAQGDMAGALKAYRTSLAICERLATQDPSNARWQRGLSASQMKLADVLVAQGDATGGLKAYWSSLAMCERLATQDPSNSEWQRDLSVSHEKVGGVLVAQGDTAGALKAYRDSLEIRHRLAAADPTNIGRQQDLAASHSRVGDVVLAQGDAAGAFDAYRESLAVLLRLAAADPTNAECQRDLSNSHDKVGDVLLAQGDAAGALKAYRDSLAIAQRLAAADPTNAKWQRDLSVSHIKVGDVLLAQGDAAGALKAYRDSLAFFQRLLAADPTNAGWQRDVSASQNRVGNVLLAQGDTAGALKAYRDSVAIAQRLSAADPTNAGWQRDLSASHSKMGDVLVAHGDSAGALKAYRDSLAISQRLSAADPTNAGWQHDLSVSHRQVGGILLARGDSAGALKACRDSLAIAQRLAAADPTNAEWQRNLSACHTELGDLLVAQRDAAGALEAFRHSLAIAQRLAAADPTNAEWQRDLSLSRERVGNVLMAQGDAAGALKAYRDSLAIAQRLAAADPTNAEWQRDLSVCHTKVCDVLVAQGDVTEGMKAYRASLAIFQRLAAANPTNAAWQRDLWVSCLKIAGLLERQREREAIHWWGRAYDILSGMSAKGLFVSSADQRILEQLKAKLGR
ncbi:MAG: tetratricopeptide repeat protein [Isosphaerales bacterium]